MSKVLIALILLATVLCVAAWAQAPTGTISGVVTDESGAVIPNANVTIHNKATGVERTSTTGADGSFSAPALASGVYEVRVEMKGFRTVLREATVEVGSTTATDIRMQIGQSSEVVTVEAAAAQVEYERHALDGVVTREQIQGLPLNGRSFLNLASIEPGVSVNIGSTSQYNAQFSVSILGADAGRTSYNVDGGNIRDSIEGTGPGMNFSQEVVQEFQLSSVNFDLSTGITAVGSVNIVTRSGSNDFHGSGYFFFRDHNMAAYPGLTRNPFNLNPFFARRNPGFWVGGPIVKDKLFFFFNFENQNQSSAVTFQPNLASLSSLAGNFTSPYKGKTLSARFDYKLNSKNTLFARYSHDGNSSVGPTGGGGTALPSNWVVNANWSDQTVFGVTTILKPTIVNDFRFSYQYWHNRNLFPTTSDCGANCLGLDDIASQISVNGSNVTIGHSTNATQGRDLRKFQFDEGLNWQKGSHRIRFGGQIELAPGSGFWGYCDPMCGGVASPETVRGLAAVGIPVAALFPNLPTKVNTYADFLNLPFLYSVIGIGDPSQPPPYNVDVAKKNNRFRLYGQDTWKIRPNFTLNYGLAWEYESNLFNHDIPKPAYIAPLYGSDLSPTNNNHGNFSPSLGFAWSPKKDNKTVIRAGAGIYYDTEYLFQRLQERAYLGPVGNGRVQVQNTAIINTLPGILDISAGVKPLPVGAPLPFAHLLTMTFGQFVGLYKAQIGPLTAALAPKDLNDLSVRNIDISKTSAQLYPKDYPLMSAIHLNAGIQRQITHDLVVSVDFARRVFNHVDLGALDTNRFNRYINGVQSPVIPVCTPAQAAIPKFPCSTGSDTFWTPGGRTVYNALLIKVDKRFSRRYQLTAGYALTDQHGYAGTIYNLDNWSTSYGPQLSRQTLNVTGVVNLPWGFQIGIISTMATKGPQMAYVTGVDLTGSGVTTTPLPGLGFNCLNRGCGKSELSSAVDSWNSTYAGKKDAIGKAIPALALPPNYNFGRLFNSQDLRLTKEFKFKERYKISVFGEMFNVLNYFNPSGYNFNLDNKNANPAAQTFNFGIPTQRTGQTFGSGGPRAVQVGGRFTF
jgi:hypothetical protein